MKNEGKIKSQAIFQPFFVGLKISNVLNYEIKCQEI